MEELINEIESRLSNKYRVLDGDHDTIIIKDRDTGKHYEIRCQEIVE